MKTVAPWPRGQLNSTVTPLSWRWSELSDESDTNQVC